MSKVHYYAVEYLDNNDFVISQGYIESLDKFEDGQRIGNILINFEMQKGRILL